MEKVLTPKEIARLARVEYARDEADATKVYPYSPARATAKIARRKDAPRTGLVGKVAEVYYEENGVRSPLAFPRGKATPAAIASAVAKRRNAGGRLGRWEVIAASLSAGLGRPVSVAAVRAFAKLGGVSETASYTGRGTRAGAVATRTSETAEVVS